MTKAVVLETDEKIPESLKNIFIQNGIETVKVSSINEYTGDADFLVEYSSDLSPDDISRFISRVKGLPVRIGITDRLLIRELSFEDRDKLHSLYHTCPEAFSEDFYSTFVESDVSLKEYIRLQYPIFGYGQWILTLKNNPSEVIGLAGLYSRNSIIMASYALFPRYRGFGYCQEAMNFIIKYAETKLNITDICAEISPDNHISRHIAEKTGIRLVD